MLFPLFYMPCFVGVVPQSHLVGLALLVRNGRKIKLATTFKLAGHLCFLETNRRKTTSTTCSFYSWRYPLLPFFVQILFSAYIYRWHQTAFFFSTPCCKLAGWAVSLHAFCEVLSDALPSCLLWWRSSTVICLSSGTGKKSSQNAVLIKIDQYSKIAWGGVLQSFHLAWVPPTFSF